MEERGRELNKSGYTTGAYAAAAAKGALEFLLTEKRAAQIVISLPEKSPIQVTIPIHSLEQTGDSVLCGVIKKSVEETDVTHNMEIHARVSLRDDDQIIIDGGAGIGRVTKIGLQIPIGDAAINPVPRRMITDSMRELTPVGINVLISAPKGEQIATLTTNARLGIIGGISIIGTTGRMFPKSLASFKVTIRQQLDFCKNNRVREVVITPGNISEKAVLEHFGERFRENRIVQSGDHLGFTLQYAQKKELPFILAGHPGKLGKILSGHFRTHYTQSPPANKAVLDLLRKNIESDLLKMMEESPTVEGITTILRQHGKGELLNGIAQAIEEKVETFLKRDTPIPILLFNMNRELIGLSKAAEAWKKR